VNQYSDISHAEFKKTHLNARPPTDIPQAKVMPRLLGREQGAVPVASDWRTKGAISPVKDQEQCGSCWAFSTTETAESFWFLQHGSLPVLAPQQIVSCDTVSGDQGCNGGWPAWAYTYLNTTGMDTEAAYPYTSGGGDSGTCQVNKTAIVTAPIKSFSYVVTPCNDACANQDELGLANNIAATGPASVCVAADTWQTYTGGVITAGCEQAYTSLDHCVQAVGIVAGTNGTAPYWLIRNSWNAGWGEAGYIYVQFGANLCGLADQATFVSYTH